MADNKINLPGGFGGLMRYDEEFETKFPLSPASIIIFAVLIIAFRVGLSLIY